jgi:hypothetical protein
MFRLQNTLRFLGLSKSVLPLGLGLCGRTYFGILVQ